MTQQEVASKLKEALKGRSYSGSLSNYAVQSIENSLSNYSVANLIKYCEDMDLKMKVEDLVTLDKFNVGSLFELHKSIDLLMKRYKVNIDDIFRETGHWYSPPKTLDYAVYLRMLAEGKKYAASISIKGLVAVCNALHCDLLFETD